MNRCGGVLALAVLAGLLLCAPPVRAQDNYEIQVYGSETVEPGHTMVELHSNFTIDGSKQITDGVYPTNHAEHETVEITHGFNDWFEVGFYIFTSVNSGQGWQWVGDHIRPRFRVPDKWHWPVGVSLSNEVGLSTPAIFHRHLDVGNAPDRGPESRPLVLGLQPHL